MTSRDNFGATTAADEVLDGIDLSGKLVVITGGASGLGQETARAMAAKGAHIVIPVRDMAKGEAAVVAIKASVPDADIELMECDLGKMASIQFFAQAFLVQHDRIDLLINNAGVMASPHMTTGDGLELQFGTNHIGHFQLTNLLMPALLKAAKNVGMPASSISVRAAIISIRCILTTRILKRGIMTNGSPMARRRPPISCSPSVWKSGWRARAFMRWPCIRAVSGPISVAI